MGNIFLGLISAPTTATDPTQVTNLIELMMKGGFIMIPIVLLSILSIYLFIERYMYIRKASVVDPNLVNIVLSELKEGHKDRAVIHTKASQSAFAKIIGSGVEKIGKPHREIESQMESTSNLEVAMMEKDTGYLGIIAGVAPMLGFIGTISGVIKIFYNISLSDNISIGIISGGLYQKMICSGTGLIVGVIAYSCYHVLQMMIDRFTINMLRQSNEFLKAI
jgi:biopolymer transport protein ExbB